MNPADAAAIAEAILSGEPIKPAPEPEPYHFDADAIAEAILSGKPSRRAYVEPDGLDQYIAATLDSASAEPPRWVT